MSVSIKTIRATLKRARLRSRVKPKRPWLRAMDKRERLEFARKYEKWTDC